MQALDIDECVRALGMESGRIRDEQLSASSAFDPLSTGPAQARLNIESGSGAWCPLVQINATSHEWIQVELREDTLITAIRTQGRWDKGRGLEFPAAYMLEYWRESLGRWARYKNGHGNEIIQGNSDTQTAVLRLLDGGIVAKLLRLIPVSESIRTVCLRFEVYGCAAGKEALVSYSAPSGAVVDQLDMRDLSYDGLTIPMQNRNNSLHWLRGGIGRLFDGAIGQDNFEEQAIGWVGWHRSQQLGPFISLEFIFARHQNLSALLLHTSNFRRHGAALFHTIRVFFAPFGGKYSQRIVQLEMPVDDKFETARWLRVPIPHRVASRLRVEISFGAGADWLLLSEVRFETADIASVDDASERLWRQHLEQINASTIFYASGNDDGQNDATTTIDGGGIGSWPAFGGQNNNVGCVLLIVLISVVVCLASLLLCLCFFLFIHRQNHRTPLKGTIQSCGGDSFESADDFCSSSSASPSTHPYLPSALHHSKSLLIQQFMHGVKRKMDSQKNKNCSNSLLKKQSSPAATTAAESDGESQRELMDIAQLVLRQQNNNTAMAKTSKTIRGRRKGSSGNEQDGGGNISESDEYACADEPTMIFANIRSACQMPLPIPMRFGPHLCYAGSTDVRHSNSKRPSNLPRDFAVIHSSDCGTTSSNSNTYRYRATPTLANCPPNFPPPPLPPAPPPRRG